VADSGPGIPPEECTRVFEKFARIPDQVPLRGSKGGGLGLAFSRAVIEAHGGRIWIENPGLLSGTCVAFTLPVVEAITEHH